jgi:hypothetical protein
MPRNGSGVYTIPAGTSATPNTTIASAAYDTFLSDISTEITNSLNVQGTAPMLANLNAGGFAITNAAGIVGVTTNSNAAAGSVGEYITADLPGGSAITWTGDLVVKNIVSVSLTPGDWDCQGEVVTLTGAGTQLQSSWWLSTTSATLPTSAETAGTVSTTSPSPQGPTGTVRFSLATTTTVYLSAQQHYSVGAPSVYGFLRARRVR